MLERTRTNVEHCHCCHAHRRLPVATELRFQLRQSTSMVRRGRRFESVRGLPRSARSAPAPAVEPSDPRTRTSSGAMSVHRQSGTSRLSNKVRPLLVIVHAISNLDRRSTSAATLDSSPPLGPGEAPRTDAFSVAAPANPPTRRTERLSPQQMRVCDRPSVHEWIPRREADRFSQFRQTVPHVWQELLGFWRGRRGGRPEHLLSPRAKAPTRAACKTDTAVRVRISDPDLLLALCDYLSEQGLIAVAASQETANVLVQTAQSDLDAELLVLAALRRWRVERPDVSVTVAPEQ